MNYILPAVESEGQMTWLRMLKAKIRGKKIEPSKIATPSFSVFGVTVARFKNLKGETCFAWEYTDPNLKGQIDVWRPKMPPGFDEFIPEEVLTRVKNLSVGRE